MTLKNASKFVLKSGTVTDCIEISLTEFIDAKQAYVINQRCLALEEKYSLILQNYADFESQLHSIALSTLLFGVKEWAEYMNEIQLVNGKLLNLLSSTKAYLDQVPQNLNDIFGDSCSQSELFEKNTNKEFDDFYSYRIMSAVRNHVQHSDFPIQLMQHGNQWKNEERTQCSHHATAYISTRELSENKKIRSKTREELVARDEDKLDVKPLVREYLSSMARLHREVRQSVNEVAMRSEAIVRQLTSRFAEVNGERVFGLAVVAISDEGRELERVPLFSENVDRRNYLIKHNAVLTNMEKHFISGEI
ncbi:hypothetical protein [Undibacterium flavidum]|uniref:Uncharacterized protein n=1 Tax=Undibacterium flavidum TaxID=2762297 RepID=A0ABR6YCL4_9BURK|nr:hypothetical protein [Undibacterium flavidum]MBC3874299.1 hypothetical protein [Undibacterium flavidum]